MKVVDDLTQVTLRQETVVTIGAFDGVHRGHQALVKGVVEQARATERLSALITFHPHPAVVLAPHRAPRYLTTPGEKAALLERLGLDLMVLMPFSLEVASISAHAFMQNAAHHLRVAELWVGADFSLGRNREGDVRRLREMGSELGYELRVTEPVMLDGQVISSSRIRKLLSQGLVEESARLLGRYASLPGKVVAGARRGHGLGFPTANLEVRPERAVPANGVYAVLALLGSERLPAVANVGVRPSFDNGPKTVETHILDFDQDIYGCDLVVEFVARLRPERRFENISDLVVQIDHDRDAARHLLGRLQLLGSVVTDAPALESLGNRVSSAERPPRERTEGGCAGVAVTAPASPCRYRNHEIEHTADRALWVWGAGLGDLFVGAALGMYELMADLDGQVATTLREVRLEGYDRESLLVAWLNELLFLTEQEGLLFVGCSIDSLTDTSLVARLGGVVGVRNRGSIKAATFHDLALVPADDGWSTVITFDA